MNLSSLNCFLPPHILAKIIELGTDQQREKAIQTIRQTNQFRLQRIAMSQQAIAGPSATKTAIKQRLVYSAKFQSDLPGTIVRQEGSPPTGDRAADEAYDGAGATYDLYWEVYKRNSIDNNGMRLSSTVHYQRGYDNAFWNGQQMVYGDGDQDLAPEQRFFNRFTIALDVIGHELTHGVAQYTSNLNYMGQPGALNESFSDVFGSQVKQRQLGQRATTADWIIGQGLFTSNVKGIGIRSMKAPGTAYDDPVLGKDPQPSHMKDYVNTTDDDEGVHINSGIPNYVFYLVSVTLGGYSWEKAGRIWYETLQRISPTSNFQDAANLTYLVAAELYGTNSLEQQVVGNSWAQVGIAVKGLPPVTNPGCLLGLLNRVRIQHR